MSLSNSFRQPPINIMNQLNILLTQTESLYNEYKTTTDPTYKASLGVVITTKKNDISALLTQYINTLQPRIDAMVIQ
jgi:hypothetical protein